MHQCCKHWHWQNIAEGLKTKISTTSGKISKNVVRMNNKVVGMKISKNIADPDFEDNIVNIKILSRTNILIYIVSRTNIYIAKIYY
jgi:hypothetical protein